MKIYKKVNFNQTHQETKLSASLTSRSCPNLSQIGTTWRTIRLQTAVGPHRGGGVSPGPNAIPTSSPRSSRSKRNDSLPRPVRWISPRRLRVEHLRGWWGTTGIHPTCQCRRGSAGAKSGEVGRSLSPDFAEVRLRLRRSLGETG